MLSGGHSIGFSASTNPQVLKRAICPLQRTGQGLTLLLARCSGCARVCACIQLHRVHLNGIY